MKHRRPFGSRPLSSARLLMAAAALVTVPPCLFERDLVLGAETGGAAPPSEHMAGASLAQAEEPSLPDADTASAGPVVLEGGLRVEVTDDQYATIVGDSASLRAVVVEMCRQAGIQLRAYGAPDRRYVGNLDNVPLPDALRSMLRSESYLVGFSEKSGHRRVTWLRVLGAEDGVKATGAAAFNQPQPAAAAPTAAGDKFVVSSSLIFQAFGTFDPQRREQAQREILTRIGDPEQLPKFLATDSKELAKSFGRYRGSVDTLRRLKSMADRADVQAKFEEIVAEVEKSSQNNPP